MRKGGYACGIQQVHQRHDPGDEIEGYYILKSANPKVAANGKPFLTGALSDRTGTMELKVWDYTGPLTAADEGTVVKVRGTVGEYRGTAQFTAARIRQAAQEDPVDVSALVPTAPIDCGAAMEDLRRAAGLHYGPGLPCRGRGHAGGPRGDARVHPRCPRAYTTPFWAAC